MAMDGTRHSPTAQAKHRERVDRAANWYRKIFWFKKSPGDNNTLGIKKYFSVKGYQVANRLSKNISAENLVGG